MEANGVPSSSGLRSLEAAPPHATQAPPSSYSATRDPPPLPLPLSATVARLQPAAAAAAAALLPKSGLIEATGVRSESACSSPPPDAVQAPPPSSAAALEPLPLRSPMPLAEPSASREGSEQPDLNIKVFFMIGAGVETVKAAFHSSQTVNDIKEFFENKGKGACSAENMVIYHDGATLSNMTKLGTLDFKNWNSIVITSKETTTLPTSGSLSPNEDVMVDEGFALPFDFFHATEDISKTSTATNETASAAAERLLIQADEPLPIESMNLVTSSSSHILIGRILTPASPNFVDQLLSNSDIHGFNTVNEVLSDINRGPPRWVSKSQALALLYNGEIFSVDAEVQGDKKDGLIWVINSTKSPISKTIKGCKAAANEESSEHFMRTMKQNGVKIDWFEVRGKLWTRRRLVLTASDGMYHVLQWKQHKNKETDVGPGTTSGESEQLARGPSENSAGDTGFEEMRSLMQGLQARVSAQLKEFEITISTRLSQFDSHIQSIDRRLQAIEQECTGSTVW